jgi:recombination protein RecA
VCSQASGQYLPPDRDAEGGHRGGRQPGARQGRQEQGRRPFRQAEFDIEFGRGISSSGCILDLGIEHNVVTKSGSFFSYGEERLGQGRNNAKAYLDEHLEVTKEIESKIYAALGIGQDLVTPIERTDVVDSLVAAEAAAAAAA